MLYFLLQNIIMGVSYDVQKVLLNTDEDPNSSAISCEHRDPSVFATFAREEDKLVCLHFNIRTLSSMFDKFNCFCPNRKENPLRSDTIMLYET